MKSYGTLRKEAWDFYSRIGSVICPTLNNEKVVFSRAGFNHLIRKGKRLRPEREQIRRLRLLPYVEKVISSKNVTLLNTPGISADFWEISKKVNGLTIKVVIRQKNTSSKHFFSIMNVEH